MLLGEDALYKLNTILPTGSTILDVGAGAKRLHANWFEARGHIVDTVDYAGTPTYVGDYNTLQIDTEYDCVWCCHTLEHQLNVNNFLKKLHSNVKLGGYVAITVPPFKHQVVSGHVMLWNAGLLLYNMVLAGFDCSNARIKRYGYIKQQETEYNISIIVQKVETELPYETLTYNEGDLVRLRPFLPPIPEIQQHPHASFNGDIKEFNW